MTFTRKNTVAMAANATVLVCRLPFRRSMKFIACSYTTLDVQPDAGFGFDGQLVPVTAGAASKSQED